MVSSTTPAPINHTPNKFHQKTDCYSKLLGEIITIYNQYLIEIHVVDHYCVVDDDDEHSTLLVYQFFYRIFYSC